MRSSQINPDPVDPRPVPADSPIDACNVSDEPVASDLVPAPRSDEPVASDLVPAPRSVGRPRINPIPNPALKRPVGRPKNMPLPVHESPRPYTPPSAPSAPPSEPSSHITPDPSHNVLRNVTAHAQPISYGIAPSQAQRDLYAVALSVPAVSDLYIQFKNNREYCSVRDELALVRASLTYYLQLGSNLYTSVEDQPRLVAHLAGASQFIKVIESLVKTCAEIEQQHDAGASVEQVVLVLSNIINVLEQEIEDPAKLSQIADKLQRIAWPVATQPNRPGPRSSAHDTQPTQPHLSTPEAQERVGRASALDDLALSHSALKKASPAGDEGPVGPQVSSADPSPAGSQ